jgi:hypothetical protein
LRDFGERLLGVNGLLARLLSPLRFLAERTATGIFLGPTGFLGAGASILLGLTAGRLAQSTGTRVGFSGAQALRRTEAGLYTTTIAERRTTGRVEIAVARG